MSVSPFLFKVASVGYGGHYCEHLAVIQKPLNPPPPRLKTPGQMLSDLLRTRGIQKTKLGELLDTNYLAINRWTNDEFFNEANQARVIRVLELDPNYFTQELERIRSERRQYREAIFERLAESKFGKGMSHEEWKDLLRLPESITVTVEYLQATVLAMRGHIPTSEIQRAVREQRKLLKSK